VPANYPAVSTNYYRQPVAAPVSYQSDYAR
jgi:hypothetical protein